MSKTNRPPLSLSKLAQFMAGKVRARLGGVQGRLLAALRRLTRPPAPAGGQDRGAGGHGHRRRPPLRGAQAARVRAAVHRDGARPHRQGARGSRGGAGSAAAKQQQAAVGRWRRLCCGACREAAGASRAAGRTPPGECGCCSSWRSHGSSSSMAARCRRRRKRVPGCRQHSKNRASWRARRHIVLSTVARSSAASSSWRSRRWRSLGGRAACTARQAPLCTSSTVQAAADVQAAAARRTGAAIAGPAAASPCSSRQLQQQH